jgi:hypothetical protein
MVQLCVCLLCRAEYKARDAADLSVSRGGKRKGGNNGAALTPLSAFCLVDSSSLKLQHAEGVDA